MTECYWVDEIFTTAGGEVGGKMLRADPAKMA